MTAADAHTLLPMLLASTLVLMAACTPDYSSREAELRNFDPENLVPKSSPFALVEAFEKFCIQGPKTVAGKEAKLKDAAYIALTARPRDGVQTFVVDSKRPAVLLSDGACGVAAAARSGQTERVRDYIASDFPDARAIDPAPYGDTAENAWILSNDPVRVVATQRSVEAATGLSRYMIMELAP